MFKLSAEESPEMITIMKKPQADIRVKAFFEVFFVPLK